MKKVPEITQMWFYFFPIDDSASEKTKADESLTILLVFGGMDTQGEIFNDCLVLMPENMKWKANKIILLWLWGSCSDMI